eukprot:scaffold445527_cov47-Prasinocladus_malaysianus.AAC.2
MEVGMRGKSYVSQVLVEHICREIVRVVQHEWSAHTCLKMAAWGQFSSLCKKIKQRELRH